MTEPGTRQVPHPVEPVLVSGLISAHDLAQDGDDLAVQVQIERTLRMAGVERMIIRPGEVANPQRHRTTDGAVADGLVDAEVRPGWCLAEVVLRPATVTLRRGPGEGSPDG